MADVCDDDGVSGESLRRKGAEKLLFSLYRDTDYSRVPHCFFLFISPYYITSDRFYQHVTFRYILPNSPVYTPDKFFYNYPFKTLNINFGSNSALFKFRNHWHIYCYLLIQVLCHEEWQMCVMMMGYQAKA